ncbi:MAG: histidinol-phosphate transaminase [Sulfolobales archaeon]|nr:histidinol-phosphate aminotransferase family protein [Sulfolobales archaeon]MDW8082410.1 histidinol-phosphate transaminase [Sulfolobales archaeon]
MRIARMHLNESPFEPSKHISSLLSKYVNTLNLYHVEELEEEFLKKLSSYTKLPREYIHIFPGSSEALITLIRFCRSRGLRLTSIWPSFHGFVEFANMEEANLDFIYLTPESFELDLAKLAVAGSYSRAIYLANPNNPTSNMLFQDVDTLELLLNRFGLVIVDEAYFEFSRYTVADRVSDYDNLIVVRTFSKAFSIAGARVGYTIANQELSEELSRYTALFSTSTASIASALGALEDVEYAMEVVRKVIELRDELKRDVEKLGLYSLDSRTNFLFIKTPILGRDLARNLGEKGIRVRAYSDDLIKNYLRVSVSSRENNLRFIEALKILLREHY